MGVKLRENIKKSGVKSLFLDISVNGQRYKEYLGLHLEPAKDSETRARNKETRRLAEAIRANKEIELQTRGYNYTPQFKRNIDFVAYYEKYVAEYRHNDLRIVRYSLEWFKKLLEQEKIKTIRPDELTPVLCQKYIELMQQGLNGETPYNYFTKFKRVIRQAWKEKLLNEDPTDGIKVVRDESLKKAILSVSEIQTLAKAQCGNPDVKRAFLLCLYTGMRWCDVVQLKHRNIDIPNNRLSYTQTKTKHSSKYSSVVMELHPIVLELIGEKKSQDELVFNLPTYWACLKDLRNWKNRAGIDKKITWHCARHSFAMNLLGESGADMKTTASLMGQSSTKHTEKYTRALDELKKRAICKLPCIEIS